MSDSNTSKNRRESGKLPPTGRIDALDLIRGVGILGILPVHISLFGAPGMGPDPALERWPDRLLTALVMLLFEGKMVTLLSILFGAGLILQAGHAENSGRCFKPYFRRRMGVLFLFGLAHALLLFQFDILTSYAVVGLVALSLLGVSDGAQRRIVAVCLGWCFFLVMTGVVLGVVFQSPPDSTAAGPEQPVPAAETFTPVEPPGMSGVTLETFFSAEHEIRVFREGGFRGMVLHRSVYLVVLILLFCLVSGWYLLACVLSGMSLVRRGIFHRTDSRRPLIRRFLGLGLGWGVPLHAAGIAWYLRNPENLAGYFLLILGMLPLGFAYLALLILWAESGRAIWLQRPLQAVGRMALTNYLMQSLLCGFVFYSYGFAWFGRLDTAALFGVVLAIWALQLTLSPWWLRRFRIGPVEWVWRSLTEGRRHSPPMPR